MTENDVAIHYMGDNPELKKAFDGDYYVMGYDLFGEGPITNDELYGDFEVGPGHLFPSGVVMCYGAAAGTLGREFILCRFGGTLKRSEQ